MQLDEGQHHLVFNVRYDRRRYIGEDLRRVSLYPAPYLPPLPPQQWPVPHPMDYQIPGGSPPPHHRSPKADLLSSRPILKHQWSLRNTSQFEALK